MSPAGAVVLKYDRIYDRLPHLERRQEELMVRRKRRVGERGGRTTKQGRSRSRGTVKNGESEPQSQKDDGFLFDPFWDDAFSSYFDPTLRTCCQIRY
jgi:hypothetical protein